MALSPPTGQASLEGAPLHSLALLRKQRPPPPAPQPQAHCSPFGLPDDHQGKPLWVLISQPAFLHTELKAAVSRENQPYLVCGLKMSSPPQDRITPSVLGGWGEREPLRRSPPPLIVRGGFRSVNKGTLSLLIHHSPLSPSENRHKLQPPPYSALYKYEAVVGGGEGRGTVLSLSLSPLGILSSALLKLPQGQ